MDILYNGLIYYTILNITYYSTAYFMFALDMNKGVLAKSQPQETLDIVETYCKVLPIVAMNTFVYSIPLTLYAGYYDATVIIPFSFYKLITDLLFTLLLIDPCFYITHRIFHIPYLYQKYHKKHHEITQPVGLSALYASPFEFWFGNTLPIFLPMIIIGAHSLSVKIWLFLVIGNTVVFAHSGYKMLADFHDKHHEYFTKNYGTDIFMDKIMGTYV